jgi:hypothetical protein
MSYRQKLQAKLAAARARYAAATPDDGCAPYATRADLNRDMLLAMSLTDGAAADKGRIASTRPKPGSREEREARAAAARLMRASGRSDSGEACRSTAGLVCSTLSRLLDPEDKQEEFELVLARRRGKKGPVRSDAVDALLAYFLASRAASGCPVEAMIADAERYFSVSRATAYAAWKRLPETAWRNGLDMRGVPPPPGSEEAVLMHYEGPV